MPNLKELGLRVEGRTIRYVGQPTVERDGKIVKTDGPFDAKEDINGVVQIVRSASLRSADDPKRKFLLGTAAQKVVRVIETAPSTEAKVNVLYELFKNTNAKEQKK